MSSNSLKSALKELLQVGERLSPLHPRVYPLSGWWQQGVPLEYPTPTGWPLPKGAAVIEAQEGYHFGPENLTLAWALEDFDAENIIDLGAGSGSLGLIAMFSTRAKHLIAIERQPQQVQRFQRTVKAFTQTNELPGDIEIIEADLRNHLLIQQIQAQQSFKAGADLILMNPPFFPRGWGRASESSEVHASTHTLYGDVSDFFETATRLLKPSGSICVLYDAGRIADLLPALSLTGLSIQKLKYCPDTRSGKQHQPFRVWLFAGFQGAPIMPLLKPALFKPSPVEIDHE